MFFLILGFKFKNAQKLKFRQNSNFKAYYNFLISKEPKPLTGSEKLINYAIIGFLFSHGHLYAFIVNFLFKSRHIHFLIFKK